MARAKTTISQSRPVTVPEYKRTTDYGRPTDYLCARESARDTVTEPLGRHSTTAPAGEEPARAARPAQRATETAAPAGAATRHRRPGGLHLRRHQLRRQPGEGHGRALREGLGAAGLHGDA